MTPAAGHRLDWASLAADLPAVLARRTRNVHKGSFGTLAIVGGADGMVGAPLLAGRAALHAGAGKVWIGLVATNPPAVDWGQPELMLRQADQVVGAGASAMVCGPGLGTSASAKAVLARMVAERTPLVLDADALNTIAADPELAASVASREAPTLATPHPAEAARLLGSDTAAVQADRLGAAQALAARFNAAVVVKGAGSVLAYPDASWDINASGNPGSRAPAPVTCSPDSPARFWRRDSTRRLRCASPSACTARPRTREFAPAAARWASPPPNS